MPILLEQRRVGVAVVGLAAGRNAADDDRQGRNLRGGALLALFRVHLVVFGVILTAFILEGVVDGNGVSVCGRILIREGGCRLHIHRLCAHCAGDLHLSGDDGGVGGAVVGLIPDAETADGELFPGNRAGCGCLAAGPVVALCKLIVAAGGAVQAQLPIVEGDGSASGVLAVEGARARIGVQGDALATDHVVAGEGHAAHVQLGVGSAVVLAGDGGDAVDEERALADGGPGLLTLHKHVVPRVRAGQAQIHQHPLILLRRPVRHIAVVLLRQEGAGAGVGEGHVVALGGFGQRQAGFAHEVVPRIAVGILQIQRRVCSSVVELVLRGDVADDNLQLLNCGLEFVAGVGGGRVLIQRVFVLQGSGQAQREGDGFVNSRVLVREGAGGGEARIRHFHGERPVRVLGVQFGAGEVQLCVRVAVIFLVLRRNALHNDLLSALLDLTGAGGLGLGVHGVVRSFKGSAAALEGDAGNQHRLA